MFDLNEEIRKWRRAILENQTCTNSDLDELESHLRDEMAQLQDSSLSEQEAFWVAAHRLGDTGALAKEFAKVNESFLWRKRCFWATLGIASYLAAVHMSVANSRIYLWLGSLAGLKGYTLAIVESLVTIMLFGLFVFLVYKFGKRQRTRTLFYRAADTSKGRFILFAGAFVLTAIVLATKVFISGMVARTLGFQQFRPVLIVQAWFTVAFSALIPLVLMAILIALRPSKYHKAKA